MPESVSPILVMLLGAGFLVPFVFPGVLLYQLIFPKFIKSDVDEKLDVDIFPVSSSVWLISLLPTLSILTFSVLGSWPWVLAAAQNTVVVVVIVNWKQLVIYEPGKTGVWVRGMITLIPGALLCLALYIIVQIV